jgi:hypothetical protein
MPARPLSAVRFAICRIYGINGQDYYMRGWAAPKDCYTPVVPLRGAQQPGEVHLNGFTGASRRSSRAWYGPNTSIRTRQYPNMLARTESQRFGAPLPGLPVRAGPMTPRRGPGQDPAHPGRNQPLTHSTSEGADVVRTSFWARRLCECGHDRGAHRHYRHGSDCALCDCPRWSTRYLISQLARRLWR